MTESTAVREALTSTLADIEPPAFHERLTAVLADEPVTPGVLTVRTARVLDPDIETEVGAMRGAGVQLSYEGLRLTRAIIRERSTPESISVDGIRNGDSPENQYYLDLLAAEVLVSRGFYHLATTGVAGQAVEIVRRFGRNQTHELESGIHPEASLEVDVIKLAVNAGMDLAGVESPALATVGDALATELEAEPLPSPEALSGIEGRLTAAAGVESE